MYHHHEKPEKHGSGASAHAPQVAVRDGNRLLCPCCGKVFAVLVDEAPKVPAHHELIEEEELFDEEPWQPVESPFEYLPRQKPYSPWDEIERRQDAVKEAAWEAFEASEKEKHDKLYAQYLESDDPGFLADYLKVPIDPEINAYEIPEEDPPPLPGPKKTKRRTVSPKTKPPREQDSETWRAREQRWRKHLFEEPRTHDRDRFLAWTFYHTKMLDLQLQEEIRVKQAKIVCLRQELGDAVERPSYEAHLPGENVPMVRPHVEVVEFDLLYWMQKVRAGEEHAHEDVNMAPRLSSRLANAKERGPP